MKQMSPTEMLYLSTAIAVELCKNKTQEEIAELKALLWHVYCSIGSLCSFPPKY